MTKWLLAVTFFVFSNAHARDEGCQELLIPTKTDQAVVKAITPGTRVRFEDGQSFQVLKVHSTKGSNGVLMIPGPRILRINNRLSNIDLYHSGYKTLAENHIPIPKMYGANPNLWIVSEFLDVEFLLSDVVAKESNIMQERFSTLLEEFRTFAFKFYGLNSIDDFHLENIGYVKNRGWVLLDWMGGVRPGRKLNPFLWLFPTLNVEEKFDAGRVKSLRIASDEAIALARGHNLDRYQSMTMDQFLEELYRK